MNSDDPPIVKVSLIIPTLRRPVQLQRALESLDGHDLRSAEVLIVDNAASPEIEHLVARQRERTGQPLRYIAEPLLGLHHARHAGARQAVGEILVFTDDDATFPRGWLDAYADAFDAHPELAAAGGPVEPRWESPPPEWLLRFLGDRPLFPLLSLMRPQHFSIGRRGVFFGVNMAIRQSVLFEMGGFNPEAFGNDWLGNGETGLNTNLWRHGRLVGHVTDAVVFHHIPPERMTVEYLRKRKANDAACDMYGRFHEHSLARVRLLAYIASVKIRNVPIWLLESRLAGRTDWLSLRIQLQGARSRSQIGYVRRLLSDADFRRFVVRNDWLSEPCTSR